MPLPAELMDPHSPVQGGSQAVKVCQLLRQGKRLMAPLQGLVWIAKMPQAQGRPAEASHPGVIPAIEERQTAVLLGVIEGKALLCVLSGSSKLAKPEQGVPQHIMGYQEERGGLEAPSQAEQLLPQPT